MALSDEVTSFEDYKIHATGADLDLRPTAVILAELDEIEAKLNSIETEGPNGA